MTNFMALLKQLSHKRLALAGKNLAGWLVATVVATGLSVFSGRNSAFDENWLMVGVGWALAFLILGGIGFFFQLAWANERVWTRAQYRLLPISDFKLNLANQLATLQGFIGFWLGGLVATGAFAAATGVLTQGRVHFDGTVGDVVEILLIIIVMHLFFWALISTENLLVKTVQAFLPEMRGKMITGGLYLVMIIVVVAALDKLMDLIQIPFGGGVMDPGVSDTMAFLLLLVTFVLTTAVLTALNTYLLKRFVEPKV